MLVLVLTWEEGLGLERVLRAGGRRLTPHASTHTHTHAGEVETDGCRGWETELGVTQGRLPGAPFMEMEGPGNSRAGGGPVADGSKALALREALLCARPRQS